LSKGISDTPLKKEWTLSERYGHLRMYGGPYNLSSPEAPTMLLRKQTAFNQAFQTDLDFKPSKRGYEAGIVVWGSLYTYASVGIALKSEDEGDENRVIILRLPTKEPGVMTVSYVPTSYGNTF
jgi:beta-xylosidase